MSIDVDPVGPDGDLLHVHGRAGEEHRAALGDRDHRDRVRLPERGQARSLERVDRDVDGRAGAVADRARRCRASAPRPSPPRRSRRRRPSRRCRASRASRRPRPGRRRSCRRGRSSVRHPSPPPPSRERGRARGCGRGACSCASAAPRRVPRADPTRSRAAGTPIENVVRPLLVRRGEQIPAVVGAVELDELRGSSVAARSSVRASSSSR